jgi:chemotaxis protein methyltransferase CheR
MTISAADFGYVRDLVRQRAAIVIEVGKEYLVESRLSGVAREEGFGSLELLVAELKSSPSNGLHRKVVDAMTTNETTFFRDVHPFEALRQHILPELIAARAAQRRLSIWCAGCSTGQEPYTIAMLLRDHFPALAGWTVRILATDLSQEVLARARAGRFTQLEVNRGLPASYLVRHFRKEGMEWQIADPLRQMVEFRELNLIEAWPGVPAADLVFMRNVLIYFDVSTKRAILGRTRRVLGPDGYLFLGAAETTLNLDDAYQRVVIGKAVCYRRLG